MGSGHKRLTKHGLALSAIVVAVMLGPYAAYFVWPGSRFLQLLVSPAGPLVYPFLVCPLVAHVVWTIMTRWRPGITIVQEDGDAR